VVDAAHQVLGHFYEVGTKSAAVARVVVDQPFPPFSDPDWLEAQIDKPIDETFETQVKAGHIAAAG
jgi:hypothetical protein